MLLDFTKAKATTGFLIMSNSTANYPNKGWCWAWRPTREAAMAYVGEYTDSPHYIVIDLSPLKFKEMTNEAD